MLCLMQEIQDEIPLASIQTVTSYFIMPLYFSYGGRI
jgi:hypothetical protein